MSESWVKFKAVPHMGTRDYLYCDVHQDVHEVEKACYLKIVSRIHCGVTQRKHVK